MYFHITKTLLKNPLAYRFFHQIDSLQRREDSGHIGSNFLTIFVVV